MGFSEQDVFFMRMAIEEATKGFDRDEVPIGAVLVSEDGTVCGKGFNSPILHNDPTAHAEIIAIREGCKFYKNYRLPGSTLYITLEPCIMCFGAIIHARVKRLVFGAYDTRSSLTNKLQLIERLNLNHHLLIEGGLLEEECSSLLKRFFELKRKMKKNSR